MSFTANNKINFNPSSLPLATIINSIKNRNRSGLDLQPKYQRGFIWNSDFKDKLIYSVSKNYPIGNIIIRNLEEININKAKSEVVDGQQRLTTLYDFFNNKYRVNKAISKLIIEENLDYFLNEKDSNKTVYKILKRYNENRPIKLAFDDFPESLKEDFKNYPLSLTFISNATTEQVSEYFRFVQNQERLKAGEIIKTIPDSKLYIYLDSIININDFLNNIGFDNSRREFDKIFYSIMGVFEKKLNLGSTDKKIMEYVENHNGIIDSQASILINNMIKAINYIAKLGKSYNYKFNKRLLKLFLLSTGFNYVQISKDTDKLFSIFQLVDKNLSAFNSAKKDSIKNALFNYSEEMIEDYRLIALIVKGSHTYSRVSERIKIFSQIINYEMNKI